MILQSTLANSCKRSINKNITESDKDDEKKGAD